jgi:hypothetical protein
MLHRHIAIISILFAVCGSSLGQTKIPITSLNATGTPSSTTYLRGDSTWSTPAGGGSGTVTSVALSPPSSIISVSGSPITTSGTLTESLATQLANLVWAGPTSGSAAAPAFRALVSADIPSLSGLYDALGAAATAQSNAEAASLPVGTTLSTTAPLTGGGSLSGGLTIAETQAGTGANGWLSSTDWNTFNGKGSGSGTVTSVAMTGDGTVFNSSVTGSPVTASGTLAPSLHTQTANTFLSGPSSGSATTPTFRAIVGADVPTLNQSTTGSAASLSISGQTGLLSIAGLTSTNRVKTVRDAADTFLELGGSYTPTGTWIWTSASVTWPTFNQNTTGSAASLSGTQTANYVYAAPNGSSGSASFRALVSADLPSLSGTYLPLTGGTLTGGLTGTTGAFTGASSSTASSISTVPWTDYGFSSGQTGDLQDWYLNSGGTKAAAVLPAGNIRSYYAGNVADYIDISDTTGGVVNANGNSLMLQLDAGTLFQLGTGAEYLAFALGAGSINSYYPLQSQTNSSHPEPLYRGLDAAGNVDAIISVGGGISNNGYVSTTALGTPPTPTLATHGTAGSTTYYYKIVGVSGTGLSLPSAEANITTGNATLSSSNYNIVTWTQMAGAESYNVYRSTTSGTETKITSAVTALSYNDVGNAASGALPTINTTGYVLAPNVQVSNHLDASENTGTPTFAAGAAITGSLTTTGNDVRGNIAGSATTASAGTAVATVTFSTPYGTTPYVFLTPTSNQGVLGDLYVSATSATAFTVSVGVAVTTGTISFNYFVIN